MLFDVYFINSVGTRTWVGHVGADNPEKALSKAMASFFKAGHDVAIGPSAAARRQRTGEPCSWVEADLCSACAPGDAAAVKAFKKWKKDWVEMTKA